MNSFCIWCVDIWGLETKACEFPETAKKHPWSMSLICELISSPNPRHEIPTLTLIAQGSGINHAILQSPLKLFKRGNGNLDSLAYLSYSFLWTLLKPFLQFPSLCLWPALVFSPMGLHGTVYLSSVGNCE